MASPFAKYQSEQVQQIAPGFVEGFGRAAASIGQGISTASQAIAGGINQYKKEQEQEITTKAALAPYIKNDERTKAVNNWLSEGKFVKADDGTVVLSANMAGKVNMDEVNKNLAFYNSTGGDGSKLSGESLNRFASMYQGEQKYASEQAAKATAAIELDLKRAQIDELKSKAAERKANAGTYGSAIAGMGFGVAVPNVAEVAPTGESLGVYNQPTGLDKPTTSAATAEPATAVPSVDNKPAGVADTAPVTATPAAAAPAAMPAAPAAKATAPAAPTAPKPAATAAAAPARAAAPAPAAAPAAPATYDVPKEAARVSGQLQTIQAERDATRTKYSTDRDRTNVLIARSKQAQRLPANKVGIDLASAANSYNQNLLKGIDEAEQRDMKKLDDRESTINREFANYQSAATAQRTAAESAATAARQAIQDKRNEASDKLAKEAANRAGREEAAKGEEAVRTAVSEYPIKGPWVHIGYDLKDKAGNKVNPARFGIAPLSTAQQNTVAETYDGWLKGTDFLIRLDDTLKSRVAGNNDYTQRFRLLASDMQNYFEGELASTFGVATFRRAIVSGGNFSDADREFVKKAITYLNTAAPDLDASDLEANTRALAVFIDNMYRKGLEGQGMVYNPEQIKKQAVDLRSIGAETQAAALEATVADSEKFYNRYGIRPGGRALTTPEEKAALLEARTTLWNALSKAGQAKGLEGSNPAKFQPKK
jgi:hypothetical protein